MTSDLLQAQIGSHTFAGCARKKAPVSKSRERGEDEVERDDTPLSALYASFLLSVFTGFRWPGTLFAVVKRLPKLTPSSNKASNKLCTAPSFTSPH